MKAEYFDRDYFIFLDPEQNELDLLEQGPIEAPLILPFLPPKNGQLRLPFEPEDIDSSKTVVVEKEENNGPDSIEVRYLPEDSQGWFRTNTIQVKLGQWAIDQISRYERFGTRYGLGDKIDIINARKEDFIYR